MSEIISEAAVALTLMAEALSLLDDPENATAASHLRKAIKVLESSKGFETSSEQRSEACTVQASDRCSVLKR
ncbi:hypothetical protein [Sphingobium indicum]